MGITDSGDREHVARTLAKVEKGRDTLLRVLSQAKGRTPEVDSEFESKFRNLRRRLDDSAAKPRATPSQSPADYPTVLVAHADEEVRGLLVASLEQEGYIVLEAREPAGVFKVVTAHSRPIHLVLADSSMHESVGALKPYRANSQIVFIQHPIDIDELLAKVRRLLGSPPPLSE
jgi:CheY-like chemotaxis protein